VQRWVPRNVIGAHAQCDIGAARLPTIDGAELLAAQFSYFQWIRAYTLGARIQSK
jgi:hypothetical protein